MDKNKINIDQYFKIPLQNFEGNADEGMFNEIKSKVDATDLTTKVPVDDYFKGAILGFEANANDLPFEAILDKVNAISDKIMDETIIVQDKISIDSYFKSALLDLNNKSVLIPFSEIRNKIAPEQIIDGHFKDALQNYEGKARDEEFALIRERVLAIQERASRKRYAWLLLLLLIPGFFVLQNYFNPKSITPISDSSTTESNVPAVGDSETGDNLAADTKKNNTPRNSSLNENSSSNPKDVPSSEGSKKNSLNDHSNSRKPNKEVKNADDESINPGEKGVDTGKNPNAKDPSAEEKIKTTEEPATEISLTENTETKKAENTKQSKPAKVVIRKPQPKFTLQLSAATAYNNRYLNTRDTNSKYLSVRNESDQGSYKNNFGIDLYKQMGKISFGAGLHSNQFGQHGTYRITAHLYDSVPVYDSLWRLIGYLPWNERDSAYHYNYSNTFSAIEIPLQASYRIWTGNKWEYEIGAGVILNYITSAKGALPTTGGDGIVQLKNSLNIINRFGSAITVVQKVHYNITPHWQLGTEIYLKTNVNSLYKKSTGITEYPYSFGWRWGIGFKF